MNRFKDKCWTSLLLGMGLVIVAALLPWVRSFRNFPDEAFDVATIYRGDPPGDIQYYPLIAQLAGGTIRDGTIKELEGTVSRSFPFGTLLPHAIGLAVFGDSGFLFADVGVSIGYYLLLVLLLRTMGVSRPLSAWTACFFALRIPVRLSAVLTLGPRSALLSLITDVWGGRIPRPFVSELILIAMLAVMLRLLASRRMTRPQWIWLAIAFGILLHSDIYSGLMFGLMAPCLGIVSFQREGARATLRNGLIAALIFSVFALFFLWQRASDHPDVPIRWGLFELNRMAGFAMDWRRLFSPLLAIALVVVTRFLLKPGEIPHADSNSSEEVIRRTWWFLAILLWIAFACGSFLILLMGKTIQPYHFNDRADRLCGYIVIILVTIWIEALYNVWKSGLASPLMHRCIGHFSSYGAMLGLMIGFGAYTALRSPPPYVDPVRKYGYAHAVGIEPSYRVAFSELTRYMNNNVRQDAVVASFDHQVFAWWMTFGGRYWFLVEPFVSSIPDEELETRLVLFCKLLGMSADDFVTFLQTPLELVPSNHGYVNVFWLGLAKYQASQWYTFSTMDQYTPEQQQAIQSSDYVWQLIIPRDELERLHHVYEQVSLDELESRSIDAMVLSNLGPEQPWSPSPSDWKLTFENHVFRLYQKVR